MSNPIVFISHNKIKEGKLEEFKRTWRDMVESMEAEKPRTLVYLGYVTIGKTMQGMLEIDLEEERGPIELYRHIIDMAGKEQDDVTMNLFRPILADEEKHHRLSSSLLGGA